MTEQGKKLSKREQKKQLQYFERRQRFINAGVPEKEVDMKIAREDYDALPTDKKLKRLENMVQGLAAGVAQDITHIMDNQRIMADTYDINVRVIKKLLGRLGIEPAMFDEAISEVEVEWKAEQEALEKARKDHQERERVEQAIQASTEQEETLHEHPGQEIPDAATAFGG